MAKVIFLHGSIHFANKNKTKCGIMICVNRNRAPEKCQANSFQVPLLWPLELFVAGHGRTSEPEAAPSPAPNQGRPLFCVDLYRVTLANLETHFPEFSFLHSSGLAWPQETLSTRFARPRSSHILLTFRGLGRRRRGCSGPHCLRPVLCSPALIGLSSGGPGPAAQTPPLLAASV